MTPTDTDLAAMRQAIAASRQARERGDMPFGATLVSPEGRMLWVARNNQISTGDCTGHAEVALVREATVALGAEALRGATVYASGEPCAMCSGAMFWAGVRRIVYAVPTPDMVGPLGGPQLPPRCAEVLAAAVPAVQVEGPLLRDEALAELRLPG
jgi:tRNA(Arg) A34 adenosine deaminase TadA